MIDVADTLRDMAQHIFYNHTLVTTTKLLILTLLMQFKKEMELDARNSKAFQPYNILPLETPDISHTILNVPEVLNLHNVLFIYHSILAVLSILF